MQVAQSTGTQKKVPGNLSGPGLGIDQVAGAPGAESGQLRQNGVDGRLEGSLEGREVSGASERPLALQRCKQRLGSVEAPVPQGQGGVQSRLLDEGQQGRCDELAHVGWRGPEGHRGGEVAGAGHGKQGRGDGLTDVAGRLAGRHIEGQLVHDRLERIRGRHRCEGGVVGAGDSAVHGCRGRMVRELEVHGGRRAFAVDFDLQSIHGRLVGFRSQALGQAGVDGHEAGGVGQNGALGGCEVAGQGVRGQVRSCGQGGHLALQCCDGCGVDSDGGRVGGVLRLWGICGEDRSQLPGGDALELYDRRRGDAVIEDPPREGGWKE